MFSVLKFTVLAVVAISGGLCSEDEEIKAALAAAGPLKQESVNLKSWSRDIASWQAPKELALEMPYYIAGHDYENRPVIIAEIGKWDVRKYIDAGGETAKAYTKNLEQFWWRVSNTTSKLPDAEEGITLIFDCNGFTNRQMASVAAIQSHLTSAKFSAWAASNVADLMIFNVNYAFKVWLNILKSVSGPLFGVADLYGTRSDTWISELRRRIPQDQLPPWYGGSQKFKPVQVFG